MTERSGERRARHLRLRDLPQATIDDHVWHPLRRALDITGFGAGLYSAAATGDVLVGDHDETGSGSNRHEELYVVLAGRAAFVVDGTTYELGPEEFLVVAPAARRSAVAREPATSVLVVGGPPGTVEPAPYEHWYMAQTAPTPAERADTAAAGLAQFPHHGQLHYQIACHRTLAGDGRAAGRHLRASVAFDERSWEWLADDPDLDALRTTRGAIPAATTIGGVHVERAGAGPTVVLLHAGIADARMWNREWQLWGDHFDVVRLDLRGFGRSPAATRGFSNAADVLAVLDELAVARAAIIGASYGGGVALDLAAAAPERIAALVLAAPSLPDHDWSPAVRAFGAREDELFEAGEFAAAAALNVDFWIPDAAPDVRAAIHEQQRLAFELQVASEVVPHPLVTDLATALPDLDVRTLIVVGSRDHTDFHGIADRLVAVLPAADRITIDGAGHLPSMERPDAFDAAVLPFVTASA